MAANATSRASRCSFTAGNPYDEAYDEAEIEAQGRAPSIEAHSFGHHKIVRFVSPKPYSLEHSYLVPGLSSSSNSTNSPPRAASNSHRDGARNVHTAARISRQHAFSSRATNTEDSLAGGRFRLGERRVGGQAPTSGPLIPPFKADDHPRAPQASSGGDMRAGIVRSRRLSEPIPTKDWSSVAEEQWFTGGGLHHDNAGTKAYDGSAQLRHRGKHADLHLRYDLSEGGMRRHSVAQWIQGVQQIQAQDPLRNSPDHEHETTPHCSFQTPPHYEDEPSDSPPYLDIDTSACGNRALATIEQFYKERANGKRKWDTSLENISSTVASMRRQLCQQDKEILQLRGEIVRIQERHECQTAHLQGQIQGQTEMICRLEDHLNQIATPVMRA